MDLSEFHVCCLWICIDLFSLVYGYVWICCRLSVCLHGFVWKIGLDPFMDLLEFVWVCDDVLRVVNLCCFAWIRMDSLWIACGFAWAVLIYMDSLWVVDLHRFLWISMDLLWILCGFARICVDVGFVCCGFFSESNGSVWICYDLFVDLH